MRSMTSLTTLGFAGSLLAFGCASSDYDQAPPTTAAAQIERGARAFADHCARCHGNAGQGGKKAPPLVGAEALPLEPRAGQKRTQRFHTALDVAQFATQNMPPDESDRAELSETDYWAIIAFDLSANGVAVTEMVTAGNASSFVLHP